jgi:hypothetical protein
MAVVEELDWTRLVSQLRRGRCTPFLGAGACGTLPTGAAMSETWAERLKYPFPDNANLPRVMQYGAIEHGDLIYFKEMVCAEIEAADRPDYGDPEEPHALLAELPVPIYLTTNYDDFLVTALTRRGKEPHIDYCRWNSNGESGPLEDPALVPTENRPLVYYMHGLAKEAKSIVLTENDYLEYLVGLVRSRQEPNQQIIPNLISNALAENPLLFIGYSMQDLTFRVLYYGLLRDMKKVNQRRNISVQLKPITNGSGAEAQKRACDFMLKNLEDWNIQIFWGTAAEFCQELRRRMNGSS